MINRSPPRCFSYKTCFITSAVSKIKGKKSKALSKSVVGWMKTSPISGKLQEQHWGQSQYPRLLVLLIFPGALLYCFVCSSFWVSTGGRTLTCLEICHFAQLQKTVTAYPFFLEGLCKMCDAQSEPCCDQAFSKMLHLTKKRTLIY